MELAAYLRPLLALLFVALLIAGIAWLVKKWGLGDKLLTKARDGKQLAVEEMLMLDAKRRLVLVRRGDVGHLLLLGIHSDVVVEEGIDLSSHVVSLDVLQEGKGDDQLLSA